MTQSRSECVLHEGLSYSSADPLLKLDLFLPPATVRTVPCVMVIAGGGFLAQDGQRFRHFAVSLVVNGFAAALIAYRGRPHHTCRETISDAKAAVRFVRSISGEYGIDPDRIAAVGRSAGGALAVLLAVTGGMGEFEGDGGHPGLQAAYRRQRRLPVSTTSSHVSRRKSRCWLSPRWTGSSSQMPSGLGRLSRRPTKAGCGPQRSTTLRPRCRPSS